MEVLTPPKPSTRPILSGILPPTLKFPAKTWSKRPQFRYKIPSFNFYRDPSFPICLPLRSGRSFQILAHLGRRTSRRNSLRKKLVHDQQVRHNPITYDPSSEFQKPKRSNDKSDGLKDNWGSGSAKERDSNSSGLVDRADNGGGEESKANRLDESVLWNKLENWVDQYKKDIDEWGIGSDPIFTVFEDVEGNVKRVSVNEDEIMRRSRVGRLELEESMEVNLKILRAESLARDMEAGKNGIPRNSSVVKFVVQGGESGFLKAIRGFTLQPELFPKLSRVGTTVLVGFVVLWAVKKLFSSGHKEVHYTEMEKEMMRRKIKWRKEREILEKVSMEVVQETSEPATLFIEKPKLDKEKLMNNISQSKACTDTFFLQDSASTHMAKSVDVDNMIQDTRQMERGSREIEGPVLSLTDRDGKEKQAVDDEVAWDTKQVTVHSEEAFGTIKKGTLDGPKFVDTEFLTKHNCREDRDMQACSSSSEKFLDDWQSTVQDFKASESALQVTDTSEVIQFSNTSDGDSLSSIRRKPRVILSVKEARDYLSEKFDNREPSKESQVKTVPERAAVLRLPSDEGFGSSTSPKLDVNDEVAAISGQTSNSIPSTDACEVSLKESVPTRGDDSELACGVGDLEKPQTSFNHEVSGVDAEAGSSARMENWIETNFHEVEPILKKIGVGFKDNYMVAREKVSDQLNTNTKITQLGFSEDDSELEWMKDDSLREIVFQVRENELAGRDPFYLLDSEDKDAFFKGLEKKVEKQNEELSKLHEWLHSNIENLDYGADGISLYDPPEKIIPRWKVPPVEKNPEFLQNFLEQRKAILAGNSGNSYPMKQEEYTIQRSTESLVREDAVAFSGALDPSTKFHDGDPKVSKTVIESSDGSVKAGTKSGKEYWQHTKKWSRGFLESYNEETDPEVKSVMKDIGKDLDRWITEKEIEEAGELMTKLPERNKKFMEKKLNKLKREMELFGPQAVVSKYREYTDEKEEDYLWWLDLPHLLCIELYTVHNGEQRVGLYSLEMATDLELEPKPYHVIAFEDAGDCKNLCYIIQAHMEMLGNGHAFVVPRPPKDTFREAKGNGFSVTVIRTGELELNVDQTLEEVEEKLTELGSKIYHDKITRERSVDISSLMQGVFGVNGKPAKRKGLRRMLKKPGKK